MSFALERCGLRIRFGDGILGQLLIASVIAKTLWEDELGWS